MYAKEAAETEGIMTEETDRLLAKDNFIQSFEIVTLRESGKSVLGSVSGLFLFVL